MPQGTSPINPLQVGHPDHTISWTRRRPGGGPRRQQRHAEAVHDVADQPMMAVGLGGLEVGLVIGAATPQHPEPARHMDDMQ
jgi:hypothetical protein